MLRRFLPIRRLLLLSLSPVSLAWGQLEPPSSGGIVALDQELRMVGKTKRVLMIGAHPDDEDTELLTILVRGMGAETAYLSLNRGEGGQNLIGSELGEALGLIRTEELLAARRLDGARQYFTRGYDFGYSKSLEETWSHWPRDTVLKDVVRVVRRFRPQVIVSIFSGTYRDGHGQHQAAGWAAREAFAAAGDTSRFPELRWEEGLEPYRPLKLYRSTRFDTAATTLTIPGGVLDPAVGKSFHQIAMAGRSLHRSQDMGQLQRLGPSTVRLQLLEDRTGRGDRAVFDGIDTTGWTPPTGERTYEALLQYRRAAGAALSPDERSHLDQAIAIASGVICDARGDDDRIVPGQTLRVVLECWNAGAAAREVRLGLTLRRAAVHLGGDDRLVLPPGAASRVEADARPAPDAAPTVPYFRLAEGRPDYYRWDSTPVDERGLPFEAPDLVASFALPDGVAWEREVTFRFNDQARGEVRRPITLVPRVDVKLEPATELWSTLAPGPRRLVVTLTQGARDTSAGQVRLELPAGWRGTGPQPFLLTRQDQRRTFSFEVRPPAGQRAATLEIAAVARDDGGREYRSGLFTVDYPHIRPRSHAQRAVAVVRTAALAVPSLAQVGYVRGAGDRVPEALRSVGVRLTLLDAATLERGDLDRFRALVVGPRAYETDSALVENNDRLLAYARRGGLVIVQYQQQQFFNGGFAPYPMTVGGPSLAPVEGTAGGANGAPLRPGLPVSHDRVTDETAPVRVLAPAHPVVLRPNRLDRSDWDGWIQERGLYFARSWDAAYHPVLETHDPGDGELRGGLLIASVGRGTYVYTGLSFFRQLPAGIPGPFRLFANLLALGRRPLAR